MCQIKHVGNSLTHMYLLQIACQFLSRTLPLWDFSQPTFVSSSSHSYDFQVENIAQIFLQQVLPHYCRPTFSHSYPYAVIWSITLLITTEGQKQKNKKRTANYFGNCDYTTGFGKGDPFEYEWLKAWNNLNRTEQQQASKETWFSRSFLSKLSFIFIINVGIITSLVCNIQRIQGQHPRT